MITAVVGITMSIGYFPQAYKIWKLKSAREISLINCLILSVGTAVWFIYGFLAKDTIVMVGFALGVVGSWLVLFLTLRYRDPGSNIIH